MVEQGPVRNTHSLGKPGRAGGINYIRQVLWGDARWQIFEALRIFSNRIQGSKSLWFVQENHRHFGVIKFYATGIDAQSECFDDPTLRNQHSRSGVAEHELHPLDRISRIHWHIRTPRLVHRQHSNHHLHRVLQANPHQHIGPNPHFAQNAGELVRFFINLPVGQAKGIFTLLGFRTQPG